MEEDIRNGGDDCPQLLDLIPNGREWMVRDSGGGGGGGGGGGRRHGVAEERKLELRLGPPGQEDWPSSMKEKKTAEPPSILFLGYLPMSGAKRGFLHTVETKPEGSQKQQQAGFLQLQAKDSSQKTEQQGPERKASCAPKPHAAPGNAAVVATNNSSQTSRTSSVPVVGWPPIRSFRKNLASSSSKPFLVSQNGVSDAEAKAENCKKGLFVKINMDGIPIGRKVDLKAYDSYEKLSSAVEDLFRGLLAAQRDPPAAGAQMSLEETKAFIGLLDGSGEYTLVYEDNEGDRMLVGDVPWEMFVMTAKRLRVLRSSELSTLSLGAIGKKRSSTHC